MENQHREIKGYRELSQAEIDLMNMVKGLSAKVGAELQIVTDSPDVDPRWVAIARTELQQGFMALTRAIAKPTFFALASLILAACTPTTYTKATTHPDGSVSIYEVDYQRDWWGIIGEPDVMGVKAERRKLILPDGSAVQYVETTCAHNPVTRQVLYCQSR